MTDENIIAWIGNAAPLANAPRIAGRYNHFSCLVNDSRRPHGILYFLLIALVRSSSFCSVVLSVLVVIGLAAAVDLAKTGELSSNEEAFREAIAEPLSSPP